jgi:hypothetical protein
MRWPKPHELRRWTPGDQLVFRNWRRAVLLFYCAFVGLLAVLSMLALHQTGRDLADAMAAHRQAPLSTGASINSTYRGR